jgi:hypothetical protein
MKDEIRKIIWKNFEFDPDDVILVYVGPGSRKDIFNYVCNSKDGGSFFVEDEQVSAFLFRLLLEYGVPIFPSRRFFKIRLLLLRSGKYFWGHNE